jgi:hypothetical protein
MGPEGRLEDVLAEWTTVHKAVRALCDAPSPALDRQLRGNLQHFNQHLRMIEELLSA